MYVEGGAQVDGASVIIVGGGHELVGASWVELEVMPAKQIQALLMRELDAEHADRKGGREELAVTTLVV